MYGGAPYVQRIRARSPYSVLQMQAGSAGQALILVVERDPHVRDLEKYFLEEAGYAVDFVGDGLTALEQARARQPQILITEILVPRLDGLALCRRLKSDPATHHIAVLIFSIMLAERRAQEAGADSFLRKPLAEKRLVETVRELMAARERRHGGAAV
jgi:CheY-like chemotaxis protein